MVAHKENKLYKVSVKGTASKNKAGTSYLVQLKSVRPNRTGNKIINFNKDSCDLLCVYLLPEDKVIVYDTKDIEVKTVLRIKV